MKNFVKKKLENTLFPIVKRAIESSGVSHEFNIRNIQAALRREMTDLRDRIAKETPDNPCIHGFKVYSQTDEDGILEYILNKLALTEKTFLEIGCGSGTENNTHYLALQGHRGGWIDGSDDGIESIKNGLGGLKFKTLLVEKHFVSTTNIGEIVTHFCEFLGTQEPALFSLDIDGNDLYVMGEAVKHFRPKVICAEYNPKFPPPFAVSIRYNESHTWPGGDYHGASLQAFCDLLTDYKLVSCNLCGANAFFVRRDLSGAFPDYAPGELYQPFRANLIHLRSEHFPTLKWLKDRLERV